MRLVLGAGLLAAVAGDVAAQSTRFVATDTIWYATNRAPSGDRWRDEPGALSFGARTFSVGTAVVGDLLWSGSVPATLVGDTAMAREDWLAALGAGLFSSTQPELPILVYVHGFGTSFEEVTEHAAELRRRGSFTGPLVVFSWPSRGSGVSWPTLKYPLSTAYRRDRSQAQESISDFVSLLRDLVSRYSASRIVVVAYSLGNQLLDGAIRDSTIGPRLTLTPLRTLAFVSPDVDATWFTDSLLTHAQRTSTRQVLYGARNDRMLLASSFVNKSPRAGRLDGSAGWPESLEVVDMTDGPVTGNWFIRHFGSNHALRRRPAAMLDLFAIVLRGAPRSCRSFLSQMARDSADRWRLTPAPTPMAIATGPDSLAACRATTPQ
ncbi:MAG: alpha/beta hydrolase [Cytophagaceae bacterium]|nr:alpha/beta hydrolase [Gemmatimonadaceae bacterium]